MTQHRQVATGTDTNPYVGRHTKRKGSFTSTERLDTTATATTIITTSEQTLHRGSKRLRKR